MALRLGALALAAMAAVAVAVAFAVPGDEREPARSIHERTREFGLLRAVGATRGQVRQIVCYESVITAVIARVLAVFLMVAVIVGVVAALVPARRGARLQVLEALRAE